MNGPDPDLFHLLGLASGASSAEVKSAFRKLAMQWHPDRNQDPAAGDYFKRLRAAHDSLLIDIDRQAAADGDEGDNATPSSSATRASKRARPRAADRCEALEVELEDAFMGCSKTVLIDQGGPCSECEGQGSVVLTRGRFCPDCHGSGRLRSATGLETCDGCGGRGFCYRTDCDVCAGRGRSVERRPVAVAVPAGTCDGDVIRVTGAGECEDGKDAGDLLVTLRVLPHALYRLEGRDLVMTRPVGALRMLLGGEIVLPHPRGRLRLAMSPGPACRREWRLEGAGWPAPDKQGVAGALRVELHPVMPENLTSDQLRKLLTPLAEAIERQSDACQSEVAAWEARWL